MARGRPWYKRDPERFLMGCKGLSNEEYGVYSKIVDYLNLRDRALPDDVKIMAGLLDCPPQRWRKIRERLIQEGKIVIRGDYLTNPRFEREKAERDLSRAEATIHGREGGRRSAEMRSQPELELDGKAAEPPKVAKKLKESSKKVATLLENPDGQDAQKDRKSANLTQGNPQAPYARARESEDKSIDSPLPDSLTTARAHDPDLKDLFDQVCEAAGFNPVNPTAIDRALRTVEAWKHEGLDFERVVLPTIRSVIANSTEGPTRVLSRFTPYIANETAKQKARSQMGQRYVPPRTPLLKREDEPERMADLRGLLAQTLGPQVFAGWFNDLRLEPSDETDDRLDIRGRMSVPLIQSNTFPTVLACCRRFGFKHVFAK